MEQQQLMVADKPKPIAKRNGSVVAQPSTEEGTLMNLIAQMATDPNADVAKLERLIQLRDHVLGQEAKRQYDIDFAMMKPKLPKVIKTHTNTQTSSKYAKLEDINTAIDPILAEYGFATGSKTIAQSDDSVTMLLMVKHRGGHYETMELTMPIDNKGIQGSVNKTKLHGISSTMSYIKRIGFCALLNISTGDDKDGNTEPKKITDAQAAEIKTLLQDTNSDTVGFLKVMGGAASVEELTDYPKAINALKSKKAQKATDAKKAAEEKK